MSPKRGVDMEYQSKFVTKGIDVAGEKIIGAYIVNRRTGTRLYQRGYECAVSYFLPESRRKKSFFSSADMTVVACDENGLELAHTHGGVDWNIRLNFTADPVFGVLRKTAELCASNPNVRIDYLDLDHFAVENEWFQWTVPLAKERVYTPAYVTTMGQPYYIEDLFFGGEFPMADNRIRNGSAFARYHIGRTLKEIATDGVYTSVPFVMGSGKQAGFYAMRDDFLDYIATICAKPARFRVQYNSWYDNMLDIDSQKIESSFSAIEKGFRDVGYRPLDCYVVDDGWIDYKVAKFWGFDRKKFPNEFHRERALTEKFGSTFGVWFGPRGGYTNQTKKYANLLSTIGYPKCRQSKDICAGSPDYIRDLCQRMASFCRDYNVSYFKIDGFAVTPCRSKKHGHPQGEGDGLYFYTFLWEEWTKGFDVVRKARKDVFLNVTSYAHCSPWFLKWCDVVWLNNCGDMGYAGKGDNLSQCLNYRDGKYRDFFEVRQLQFPSANIYNHEPCYAVRNCNPPMTGNQHTPDAAHPTVIYDPEQFRTYLYFCMMRGTGFVELYFSPALFDKERYQAAAEVLTWAEENFPIIQKSRFFGEAPEDGGIYGYYAWNNGKGILAVRNSSSEERTYSFIKESLDFTPCTYELEKFYPEKGEAKHIQEGETVSLEMKPYEVRLYYLTRVEERIS